MIKLQQENWILHLLFQNTLEKAYSGKVETIKIVSIKGIEATAWIESYSNFYIKNLMDIYAASEGDKEIFNKIYEGYKKETFKLKTHTIKDTVMSKTASKQSVGMFIMFIMLSCSTTAGLILQEKRERTYQRICTAPVTSKGYIASNVLLNIFIVAVQIVIVQFCIERVLKLETFVPTTQMLGILMTFGLAAIGIGMMIVAFASSSNALGAITTLVVTPTCMLSGCFWSIEIMPKVLQKISYFMPQTWVIDAISKIQRGESFASVQINILILIGFAATFSLIAAYKMKNSNNIKNFV
jgi:ABC-2 type transport system permease protein